MQKLAAMRGADSDNKVPLRESEGELTSQQFKVQC